MYYITQYDGLLFAGARRLDELVDKFGPTSNNNKDKE